ncbi:MAG TPA: hypothetical protein PK986_02760 [Spirochaetota bacterium]|nr:hypothetical protein [Spirochaetota bacterium]HQO39368.1 hypothetical protein [Spirochaetota bacterium]
MEDLIVNSKITAELKKISPFVDFNTISRIINKLTDYAEMLTEGKLAGIVNYNYRLNSSQSNMIIDLLVELQALSRVYNIAHKGKRDLEVEYISNIFSDINNPASISSYISMRNILENRLNHQIQQYNMNMNKSNTTLSIPLNELHGHVKTYRDMSSNSVTISSKVQHGFITASLHDAYVIIMNRDDWWDDKTYIKYFFNEEDSEKRHLSLITRARRLTLREIEGNVKAIINYFMELYSAKTRAVQEQVSEAMSSGPVIVDAGRDQGSGDYGVNVRFSDRILMTPFGKQYGSKIDSIIDSCFSKEEYEASGIPGEDDVSRMVVALYQVYKALPGSLGIRQNRDMIMLLVQHLLNQEYGIKQFAEKYLYTDRKISFSRFYADIKNDLEEFLTRIFTDYFEEKFSSVFRIIRSLDMKQYACAFIIKRIYLKCGENLNTFGFFIIKAISKYGKIKVV